ncbi:Solute carrier family 12 member 1 [Salmo salar]|uniref:Solute carrier family 12 member 1 n=1 Tax=Salmo salar TaxID=8030 RepID=B5XFZ6_SALSA|nr:Solute carrier family 12 member 1 [Salmo salar]ACI69766.1 Solute carrier family 12 member 1 [Salmo salar]|eukprot:NP_001134992.1 Solute carrier family 12 member 1 [Salmo salar]
MENDAYDRIGDEPPNYEETSFSGGTTSNGNGTGNGEHRAVRPSVVSAFGHDTLDRVPNIDFYRNAGSVSGNRAVRPSLQELHDVFQKVSVCLSPPHLHPHLYSHLYNPLYTHLYLDLSLYICISCTLFLTGTHIVSTKSAAF